MKLRRATEPQRGCNGVTPLPPPFFDFAAPLQALLQRWPRKRDTRASAHARVLVREWGSVVPREPPCAAGAGTLAPPLPFPSPAPGQTPRTSSFSRAVWTDGATRSTTSAQSSRLVVCRLFVCLFLLSTVGIPHVFHVICARSVGDEGASSLCLPSPTRFDITAKIQFQISTKMFWRPMPLFTACIFFLQTLAASSLPAKRRLDWTPRVGAFVSDRHSTDFGNRGPRGFFTSRCSELFTREGYIACVSRIYTTHTHTHTHTHAPNVGGSHFAEAAGQARLEGED